MGYQFTLLDHWSLYESMMHSNYLMIKLNLWEDKGVNSLHRFLHMIGISLSEAKQLYKFMSVESMKKL
jgi:cell division control protein 45